MSIWPAWTQEEPWLAHFLSVAESEARERGDEAVYPHHLALALCRDAEVAALLGGLGVGVRRWRDYLNFVLGVNTGMRSAQQKRLRPETGRDASATYYCGPLQAAHETLAIMESTREEVTYSQGAVEPRHLLATLLVGGHTGSGTARWLGLTAAAVREAGGLPRLRRSLARIDPASLPRPRRVGPLVLLGGGPIEPGVLTTAVDLARSSKAGPVRVVILAAGSAGDKQDPRATHGRREDFLGIAPDVEAIDAWLSDAEPAHCPDLLQKLAEADVVFLEGGRTERLYTALAGTPAGQTLVEASDRGAVIAGYSAGGQVLGAGMLTEFESLGSYKEALPLLGWLSEFVVLPHCSGPNMQAELRETMDAFPLRRGLGVAHGGAVLLPSGWRRIENLSTGYDEGSIVLDALGSHPHELRSAAYEYMS